MSGFGAFSAAQLAEERKWKDEVAVQAIVFKKSRRFILLFMMYFPVLLLGR